MEKIMEEKPLAAGFSQGNGLKDNGYKKIFGLGLRGWRARQFHSIMTSACLAKLSQWRLWGTALGKFNPVGD